MRPSCSHSMPLVFISYRRRDAGSRAPSLHWVLSRRFPGEEIFIDERSIPWGADFPTAIRAAVTGSQALLAMIGPRWMDGPTAGELDYVVLEISLALEAPVPVLPLLFDRARMPERSQLPTALARLPDRQARSIPQRLWMLDLDSVAEELAKELGVPVATRDSPWPGLLRGLPGAVTGIALVVLLAVILLVALT